LKQKEDVMSLSKKIAVLLVSLLFAWPMLSAAHASVVRSIPQDKAVLSAPPKAVQLWFSGKVEAGWSKVEVRDSHGELIATGEAEPIKNDPKSMQVSLPSLNKGTYEVRLNVISYDGHRIKSRSSFTVK